MMNIEKNLNKKDVRTLKTDVLDQIILQCYKHQQYKTTAAIERINRAHYTEQSVKIYMNAIKKYLFTGETSKHISKRVYALTDLYKQTHVGILTPPENEREILHKIRTTAKSQIKTTLATTTPKTPTTPTTPITPTNYAIKIKNTFRFFDNKDFCLGYIECFNELNKEQKAELVKFNYELVEENENNDGNA